MSKIGINQNAALHAGHRKRFKTRFLEEGLDSFADHEILELLLFYSIPQKNTNEIAHRLIRQFGSLHGVFSATVAELTRVEGISDNSATHIRFIASLFKQLSIRKITNEPLGEPPTLKSIGEALTTLLSYETNEAVYIALFDGDMRILGCQELHTGNRCSSNISVRSIINCAIQCNAQNIILAHNHPNSSPLPSAEDIQSTHRLLNIPGCLDLQLVEHFVIADEKYHPIINTIDGQKSSMEILGFPSDSGTVYF